MEDKKTIDFSGKAKGGKARSEKLSPERRSEIARKAALARHRSLEAIRKGNFKEEFGFDVECYVLNDDKCTAVVSQSGMAHTLGLGNYGSRLPRFISNTIMSKYIEPELRYKIENPLIFQGFGAGQVHGFDVTILIDICKAILAASEDGLLKNENVIRQANIIISASAKAGIQGLVYALAGFDRTNEQIIQAYRSFIFDEAKKYEKEFPNELYIAWAKLFGIPKAERGRNWKHMHLTIDHVYYPLAKSDGKLLTLLRDAKANHGQRGVKLFQFLNEIGAKALRMQLGRVLEMAESSKTQQEYENKIIERFGGQPEMEFLEEQEPNGE